MKSILYIINSHFWKSVTGPFFAFGFPIIFIAILGLLLGYDQILGGILTIPATTISLTMLPIALFEFKSSSLLKRIGVSSIKPWVFMASISCYYVLIMILGTMFTFLMSIVIFSGNWNDGRLIEKTVTTINGSAVQIDVFAPSFKDILKNVNWGGFLYGNIMNIAVSTSLGLLLSSVFKSSLAIEGASVPILIISEFLAAQALPIAMVKDIDALYFASYITPFKYSVGQIIESWTGNVGYPEMSLLSDTTPSITLVCEGSQNIFNVNEEFKVFYKDQNNADLIFNKTDKILNLIMPFVFIVGFTSIALKRFKWSNR